MKIGTYTNLRSIGLVVLLLSVSSTGCTSTRGWKMPKMFSWNREPSATTLAGTTTPPLPESPANKYSPNAIASVGAGSSGYGTSSGNKAPTNGLAGQSSSTTQAGTPGLAATANGYQTGPYQVGNNAKNNVQSASAYSGTTSSQPNALASGLPNPYGGSYSGMNNSSELALPNNVKSSLASGPNHAPSSAYGASAALPGTSSANTGYTMPDIPAVANSTTAGVSSYSPTAISYPSLPNVGQADVGVGGQGSKLNVPPPAYPAPSANLSAPPATAYNATNVSQYPGSSQPATYQPANYQPGTTARTTTYDFGANSTTGTVPPQTTLPPNTASGSGPGIIPPSAPTSVYR